MRVIPSLPQRGRQPKGNIPLTLVHLSRLKREFLVDLQRAIVFFMNASWGQGQRLPQPKRASEQFSNDFYKA